MNKLSEPGPYPIADDHWPLTLPVAEVTLASIHVCYRCGGHELSRRGGPCEACDGRGAILPGGTVLFDCAARWDEQKSMGPDLAIVSVIARLRSPWRGLGGWWTEGTRDGEAENGTSRAEKEARATGVNSLRNAAEDAVCEALRYSRGLLHRSIVWQGPFEWPATWGVSHRAMNVREELLMAMDLPRKSLRP